MRARRLRKTSLNVGFYSVRAQAWDNNNNVTGSALIRFAVNATSATPPPVVITSPTNGTTLTSLAPVALNATAMAATGPGFHVQFSVASPSGSSYTAASTFVPYTAQWVPTDGGHSITAHLSDGYSFSISAPTTVVVNSHLGPFLAPRVSSVYRYLSGIGGDYSWPYSSGGSAIVGYTCQSAIEILITAETTQERI